MGHYCSAHLVRALEEYCAAADEKGVTVKDSVSISYVCSWCGEQGARWQLSYYAKFSATVTSE